mgnify:CR=1 FL=1
MIEEKKPVLGICLGAQLIAKALGSKIFPNNVKEVGWAPVDLTKEGKKDPLFEGIPAQLTVLHWHGDTFNLPKKAELLVSSPKCLNQAFRYGDNVYAFQFHIEVMPDMVKEWVRAEEDRAYVRSAKEDPDSIIEKTPRAFAALKENAQKILSRYFKLAYLPQESVH